MALAQYSVGAVTEKPAELRANFTTDPLPKRCEHAAVWWKLPPEGRWLWGPHFPLRGKIKAVPEDKWTEEKRHISVHPNAPYLHSQLRLHLRGD